MSSLNESAAVRKQYASPEKLDTRISIHDKHSTNPQGFSGWIASHYRFAPGVSVLELGCGTGSFWLGRENLVRNCSRLVLSDFSEGMLRKAKETLRAFPSVEYAVIDIQDIPFAARSFDVVIANMMLYHVPDLPLGLTEVRRVLKEGGTFYSATYGEHGIMEYLCGLFGVSGPDAGANHAFTLQNGEEKLRAHFVSVQRLDYPDSLAVTDVGDLADYVLSLTGMSALKSIPREEMISVMKAHMKDGVLSVPKEYGLFVSR